MYYRYVVDLPVGSTTVPVDNRVDLHVATYVPRNSYMYM